MARTYVFPTVTSRNGGADCSGTVFAGATGTNGKGITGMTRDETLILIENTGSVTGAALIKTGDYFTGEGVGDLSVMIGGGVEMAIIVDGSRFKQGDNTVNVDFVATSGASFTGVIRAINPTGLA